MQSKVHWLVEVGYLLVWLSQTTLGRNSQTTPHPKVEAKANYYEVCRLHVLLVVLAWFCTLSTCFGTGELESIRSRTCRESAGSVI